MSTVRDNRFYRELKYDGRKPEPPYDGVANISQKEYDDFVEDAMRWRAASLELFAQLQDARDVLYVIAEQSNDGFLLNHIGQYDDVLSKYKE